MLLQDKMLSDLKNKKLFEKATRYAMNYADNIFSREVYPTEEALKNLSKFEESLPMLPMSSEDVLDFLNQYGSPATIAQIGGRYYGLVNGGVIPTALAVKYLTDFWDQNTPLYITSPVVSKIEQVVEKWLVKLFNLPEKSVAGFVSGTSMSILCGLAAARWRIYNQLGYDINKKGLIGAPKIRVVMGKHAHGAVSKALAILGLGTENIEWVDVDNQGRMILSKLPPLDEKTILILQAGNVDSGAFDDFEGICNIAKKAKAWVHIDGAFGLWVAAAKELCHLTKGIEQANSWSVDGHKALNTPYDCGVIMCKDEKALISALEVRGDYLLYSDKRDGMNYTTEMSRRARAVELWAIMKALGKDGIDEMIKGLNDRAIQFAKEISAVDGFKVLNEIAFNQVIVQCKSDEMTKKVISKIQELRECWVGGSTWFGKEIIRVSICSWVTSKEDISRSVNSFNLAKQLVLKEIENR